MNQPCHLILHRLHNGRGAVPEQVAAPAWKKIEVGVAILIPDGRAFPALPDRPGIVDSWRSRVPRTGTWYLANRDGLSTDIIHPGISKYELGTDTFVRVDLQVAANAVSDRQRYGPLRTPRLNVARQPSTLGIMPASMEPARMSSSSLLFIEGMDQRLGVVLVGANAIDVA